MFQHLDDLNKLDIQPTSTRDYYSAIWNGEPSVAAPGTKVFVKVFPEDSKWFRRLESRSNYLRNSCKHPNLAQLFEVGRIGETENPVVVSEFIEGSSLRERMEDFRSPANAVGLFQKITSAISHLHSFSIVHRDLKPENIMIAENELFQKTNDVLDLEVKVCDFDIAKPVDDLEVSSRAIGTRRYMAPEQRDKKRKSVLESDIYSIGLMLYEILAGRPVVDRKELRPSRYNRAVRGNLDQIILSCLQQTPARRCSVDELLKYLEEFEYDCVSGKKFPLNRNIPPKQYTKFLAGDFELDVVPIIGGDAVHRYDYPRGIVVDSSLDNIQEVPNILLDASEDWLRWREADARRRGAPFENRRQPRVLGIGADLTEGQDERLYPLRLKIGVTDYFNTQCTNFAINLLLPNGECMGEAFGGSHNDFTESELANPLATNFSVVTCGDNEKWIFMTQRGKMVGGNAEFDENNRVPAISGTGHPFYDRDASTGKFCPFEAGRREAVEETLGDYPLQLEELVFFGFARTGLMMFPFLFGEIRLNNMKAKQFRSQRVIHRNDVYAKEGRPFTISSVTDWIKELYQRHDKNRKNISRPSHTGIFSLYQSLIYEFPDDIGKINQLLTES